MPVVFFFIFRGAAFQGVSAPGLRPRAFVAWRLCIVLYCIVLPCIVSLENQRTTAAATGGPGRSFVGGRRGFGASVLVAETRTRAEISETEAGGIYN